MPRRARHYIANQPYHVVIYMDVMYAGFAGAKTCSTLKGSEPFNFDVLGQGWVEVGNLQVGQLIETKDGKPAKVKSLKDTGVITTTYNFDVKDIDSYYVSAAMVLVHNSDCWRTIIEPKNFGKNFEKAFGKGKLEQFREQLAQGKGSNIHDLTGELKGYKAVDVENTGKGRGTGRVVFKFLENGAVDIKGIVKGHDYKNIITD